MARAATQVPSVYEPSIQSWPGGIDDEEDYGDEEDFEEPPPSTSQPTSRPGRKPLPKKTRNQRDGRVPSSSGDGRRPISPQKSQDPDMNDGRKPFSGNRSRRNNGKSRLQ